MNATKSATLVALVLAAAFAVTGCSPTTAPTAPVTQTVAPEVTETAAPEVIETEAPEVTETPAPEVPVADEFSQVIDGVVFQGTEVAPVRIGTDIPGAAPVVEAQMAHDATANDLAEASNKYLVYVAPTEGGWYWKVFGVSRHGSFRELANSGLGGESLFVSADGAIGSAITLDGRVLDRAEYLLYIEN